MLRRRNTPRRILNHRGVAQVPIHGDHEPIPGEIESRLTKPKDAQELYQVFVEVRGSSDPVPISPKMIETVCDELCAVANKAIIDGVRREWANAYVARAA